MTPTPRSVSKATRQDFTFDAGLYQYQNVPKGLKMTYDFIHRKSQGEDFPLFLMESKIFYRHVFLNKMTF